MPDAPVTPQLEFPLEWNGKVIACDTPEMPGHILGVLKRLDLSCPVCRGNASAKGRYVTYNLNLLLMDRPTMEKLFSTLAAIPGVKMVL